ncbi:ATP-dependent helicase [Candidatus Bipolaricaulota bacterium]|nr:ATP-dependent helicase [Candidatus Bipolaricaulota bacterium]
MLYKPESRRSPILFTMDLLTDLNPRQREAVTAGEGPLLIVAGVGTGKTTVITRRIAWLIAEKLATPSEILALTFTERAAAEMEERVDTLVPYGYVEAQIGTFHAFCDRTLRENAVLLGLSPDYRILTEAEQAIFLKDHLFDLPLERFRPLGNPMRHLRALTTLFSRAKDEDVTPAEYAAFAERLTKQAGDDAGDDEQVALLIEEAGIQTELAATYGAYQRLLAENAFVDFGDLIALTLRLFREHPTVLQRYRDRFRFILVDEFQDTNYAQFELLRLLASHRNLTVCGDDDQSIYKFRGAAISNILGFQQAYPKAKLVVLDRNYRSTQAILDSAYRLIQNNNPDRLEVRAAITKRLTSENGPGRAPIQAHFETLDDESDFVARTIAERHCGELRPYGDFAILVRSNAQADAFLQALNLMQIPWRFSGSRGLYDQEEVRAVIALLRTLADPRDTMSLHFVASSPPYDIQADALAVLTGYARRQNKTLLQAFRIASRSADFLDISEEARVAISNLLVDLDELLPLSTREQTGELLYRFLSTQTGMIERLSNSPDSRDALRMQNLAKLFGVIERFARVARYDRVGWFIRYLDDLIESGDNPPVGDARWETDAVNVLTIHQAKGLEYPVVFLAGLVSGRFPTANRHDPIPLPAELVKDLLSGSDFHQQEERRLFYVGMTRAKDDVYLTSGQDYGGKRPRKPSLFVSEALDLNVLDIAPRVGSPLARITRHGKSDAPEEAGQLSLLPPGDDLLTLSHQRVADYMTCPLRYRYAHVLRVPQRPHHSATYGSAIHHAIRLYHLSRIAGQTVSLADLQQAFRKHWQSEGFLSREHEELRLQQGAEALKAFFAYETSDGVVPSDVEKRFSFNLDDIRVIGIFDRIDTSDGGAGTIIDYKTSDVQTEKEAEKRAKESRQLAIYALGYESMFDALPLGMELRFLTPSIVIGRTVPTEKSLQKASDDIRHAAEGIRANRFPAEPAYQACGYCPFATICPSRQSS